VERLRAPRPAVLLYSCFPSHAVLYHRGKCWAVIAGVFFCMMVG